MTTRALPILLLLSSAALPACVGPDIVATAGFSAAQAGVSEFNKGRLKTAWLAPIETMFDACYATLQHLGYKIEGERHEGDDWFIGSRELDGTSLEIYLYRSSPRVTAVSIRVGSFGDQPLSRLIADSIDRELSTRAKGAPVPYVIPPDATGP